MRADILAGSVFPDYDLPDQTGTHRKLSEIQGRDPLIVILARGGFCPKDRRQHEGLLQLYREMTVGYCRIPSERSRRISTSPSTPIRRTTR
jgi:peroxiredoxin